MQLYFQCIGHESAVECQSLYLQISAASVRAGLLVRYRSSTNHKLVFVLFGLLARQSLCVGVISRVCSQVNDFESSRTAAGGVSVGFGSSENCLGVNGS